MRHFKDAETLKTILLMTPIVTFIAILITSQWPPPVTRHVQTHAHTHIRTHSRIHHTLRDTRLFFLIKEIALLCWLFYLKPWLPLCAPDHAVTETRRRAAGLIGAWDARGGAAKLDVRIGEPLMGLPACGSLRSLQFLGLGCNALIGLPLIPPNVIKSPAQNSCDLLGSCFCRLENRFSFYISITEWMQMPTRRCSRPEHKKHSSPSVTMCVWCKGSYPCICFLLLVLF